MTVIVNQNDTVLVIAQSQNSLIVGVGVQGAVTNLDGILGFTNGSGFTGNIANNNLSLVLQSANATQPGQLASNDWVLFNSTLGNVTLAQGNITALQGNMTASQVNITTLQGNVSNLTTDISALNSAMRYIGGWDASSGAFPVSSEAGYVYSVTVAGTVDGIEFVETDRLLSILDNASTTIYAGNWLKEDYTDKIISVNGQVGNVNLTTANVTAATDKNYVTNAGLAVLNVTSGTNTGDQNLSSYATLTDLNTTNNALTSINSTVSGKGTSNLSYVQGNGTVSGLTLSGNATGTGGNLTLGGNLTGYVPTNTTVNGQALTANVNLTATNITMAAISGSTYYTVQDMQDQFHSTGWTVGGAVTNAGGGLITVALGNGFIRATNSDVAQIVFCKWDASTAGNVLLTDGSIDYLYVEYNAGTPRLVTTTTKRTDLNTNIFLAIIHRNGTTLHINDKVKFAVSDHAGKMIQQMQDLMPYDCADGNQIGATGTRNFSISLGKMWMGLITWNSAAFNSATTGTFTYIRQNGSGGWTETTAQTQINNTQYDDGDGTLGTLTNNNYGVHWVYRETDDDVVVLYGQNNYTTLATAQDADPPASLPNRLVATGYLVGKIIILKSAAAFAQIESACTHVFTGSLASDHATLANLDWASSGHTGTVDTVSGFNATGVAVNRVLSGTGVTILTDIAANIGTPASGNLTNCNGTAASLTAGNVTNIPNLSGVITGNATGTTTLTANGTTSAGVASWVSNETGTGSLVFNTNATLITCNLGTPSVLNLTNAVAVNVTTATGTLAVANGGTGVASSFVCQAWVNFNGTGTVTIRASGNVSSITDNGTGDYTINFTAALSDANYCVTGSIGGTSGVAVWRTTEDSTARTASLFRISTLTTGTPQDYAQVNLAIFR